MVTARHLHCGYHYDTITRDKRITVYYRGQNTVAQGHGFYFRVMKTISYNRAQRVRKIWFLPRGKIEKFISSCRRVIVFLLYRQNSLATSNRKRTSSIHLLVRIWKICHSGPGCSFVLRVLRTVYFPLKHSCRCYNELHLYPRLWKYIAVGWIDIRSLCSSAAT